MIRPQEVKYVYERVSAFLFFHLVFCRILFRSNEKEDKIERKRECS